MISQSFWHQSFRKRFAQSRNNNNLKKGEDYNTRLPITENRPSVCGRPDKVIDARHPQHELVRLL